MKTIGVDSLAKSEEAVPIELFWLGIVIRVMMHAICIKQDGRSSRDMQSIFESV